MRANLQWISAEILPHEAAVRRWLRQVFRRRSDEDDLIQEAYCRLSTVSDPRTIKSGRAYFFVVVRNLMLEKLRRERVVKIEMLAEIETLRIVDSGPLADRQMSAREQLELVQRLIEGLPIRCRNVFRLRRVEGLSQRDTAKRLELSENIVEKEVARGLQLIIGQLAAIEDAHQRDVSRIEEARLDRRRD